MPITCDSCGKEIKGLKNEMYETFTRTSTGQVLAFHNECWYKILDEVIQKEKKNP